MLTVQVIPTLNDNFSYLICDKSTGTTGVIDPGDAKPILDNLHGKKLDYILNTHHHWDHTDGNLELKHTTNAKIIASKRDKSRIPGIDIHADQNIRFGNCNVDILHIPGHTLGHIALFFREDKVLFTGDTLFVAGCGRVFEGSMEQMYYSLQLLKNLPKETQIYCGHEYTAYNLRFALSIEPNNNELKQYYKTIKAQYKSHQPTVPSTIKQEKNINPFFRTSSAEIKSHLKMESASELAIFTKLRELKDAR